MLDICASVFPGDRSYGRLCGLQRLLSFLIAYGSKFLHFETRKSLPPSGASSFVEESFEEEEEVGEETKRVKKENSFSSSTSKFVDGLRTIQTLSRARKMLEVVVAILAAKDLGFKMTPTFFDEITHINRNSSHPGKGTNSPWTSTSSSPTSGRNRFPPIYPFPAEYLANKNKLKQRNEVSWVEVFEQQKRYLDSLKGQFDVIHCHSDIFPNEDNVQETVNVEYLFFLYDDKENLTSPKVSSPVTTSDPPLAKRARDSAEDSSGNPPCAKRVRVEGPAAEVGDRTKVHAVISAESHVVSEKVRVDENVVSEGGQVTNNDERAAAELAVGGTGKIHAKGVDDERPDETLLKSLFQASMPRTPPPRILLSLGATSSSTG
ncbi:unnamed protein product [Cochlearia groenlandica]